MSRLQKLIAVFSFAAAILAFFLGIFGFGQLRREGEREMEKQVEMRNRGIPVPEGHDGENNDLDMVGAPAGEEINQALRLFTGNGDFRQNKNEINAALYLATILAYASVLGGGGLGIWLLIRQTLREVRLLGAWKCGCTPAAVVFNLPDNLRSLIPDLAARHVRHWSGWTTRPVVVVLPDRNSPLASACERAGLWVIEAISHDDDFLERSGALGAPAIYIFGGDSLANLDLALLCQKMARGSETIAEIHVAIEDPDVRHAVQPQAIGDKNARVTILPFSLPLTAAHQALRGGRLAEYPRLGKENPDPRHLHGDATYLLFGTGRYLRAFTGEILRNSITSPHLRPRVLIYCPDADQLEERLNAEIPEWGQLHARVSFHSLQDLEPESCVVACQNKLRRPFTPDSPWNFFCLLPDDADNLSLASRLVAELAGPDTSPGLRELCSVLFLSRETKATADFFSGHSPPGGPELEGVGCLGRLTTLGEITRDRLLPLAIAINQGYNRSSQADVDMLSRAASLPSLQRMAVIKREQNFSQADHVDVKLAMLGLPPSDHVTPEKVAECINGFLPEDWQVKGEDDLTPTSEALAKEGFDLEKFPELIRDLVELEHIRWMQTHILAGYRFRPRKNGEPRSDDLRRDHDCLIPLGHEDFPKETIHYDLEATRILPLLVSEIHKHRPPPP